MKHTLQEYFADNCLRLSASLAFYSVLSLAPVLIFALALAGVFGDTVLARSEVSRYITAFAGAQVAEAVVAVLENSVDSANAMFATIAGFVVLIFGATGAFAELQSGLNTIWKVEESGQVRAFFRRRLISAVIIFLITITLMLLMVVATAISFVADFIRTGSYVGETLWFLLRQATSLVAFTALFAAMFKFLPRTSIPWRQIAVGALFTALLFSVGTYLIQLYLEQASLESSYGAAGSVVALLLWVYYSTIIFYLGAELTSVMTRECWQDLAAAKLSVD